MGLDLRLPNITGTTEQEQLTQIKSYLYQLAQQLQWGFNTIETSSVSRQVVNQTTQKGIVKTKEEDAEETFSSLKALIIRSTDIVDAYYNEISTRLGGMYVARSDFGTYTEKIEKLERDTAAFNIKITKILNAQGWYKVGTLSGEMCAVATITVGGISVNNQASPSMVDIATQYDQARTFLRLPSLADNQISKIGVVKESTKVYGVYAYYNTNNENTVNINIHIHMGAFVSADLAVASVTDSDMFLSINVKQ